jgi:hypothetical protein
MKRVCLTVCCQWWQQQPQHQQQHVCAATMAHGSRHLCVIWWLASCTGWPQYAKQVAAAVHVQQQPGLDWRLAGSLYVRGGV